ncbi:unnamed protein product [Polarella glacialis]|uniref:Calmodulin-lysine N-methyltransferase n=1 Tax=Polarella glacialis TaxID=89957 RepID=A0A813FBC8_POLGL|nr:unnamed protein product [Polarella glacialis]
MAPIGMIFVMFYLLASFWKAGSAESESVWNEGKLACFDDKYPFRVCCSRIFGPRGNALCFGTGLSFEDCCCLAPWNDNDGRLPLLSTEMIRIPLRLSPAQLRATPVQHRVLQIYQAASEEYHDPGEFHLARGGAWPSGLLWTGGYQLLRWFECFADLPAHAWRGKRFIEFGAGIGAAGVVAALNGANVTLIEAVPNEVLGMNILKNLPESVRSRVVVCQMNWSRPLHHNLRRLASCTGGNVSRQDGSFSPKYDLVANGVSAYFPTQLFELIHAVSSVEARVLIAPGEGIEAFWERAGQFAARYFTQAVVRADAGLTVTHQSAWASCGAAGCPLLELSGRRLTALESEAEPQWNLKVHEAAACKGEG